MAGTQGKRELHPSESPRSIELLSEDPSQYGKALAEEAFDHFVSRRTEGAGSSDKGEKEST